MKKTNKKGFTIVELVIVIAVIAILAGVLIPTFSSIIKKANLSADQQAVRQLNIILTSEDIDKPTSISEVEDILAENGYTIKGYTPLTSDHSFIWDGDLNRILLFSNDEQKVVYPEEYADKYEGINGKDTWTLLSTSDNYVAAESVTDLVSAIKNGGVIKLNQKNAALTGTSPALIVEKNLIVELNGANITVAEDTVGDGVFYITDGATLTLNGDGIINGVGNNNYNMAIWANGGNVVINGGTYTNVGATDSNGNDDHFDLIYAKNGGTITINGGSFKCETPKWTINHKDNAPGLVVIRGGEFFEFDPSKTKTGDDTTYVPDGYKVVSEERADGIWYIVVPE